MSGLRNMQISLRDTIAFGPSACPVNLFGGPVDNVIKGLKVHANAISFARLTALEATFPRARDWVGHGHFNDLSRRFIEGGGGPAEPLALIGRDFPDWLVVQDQDKTLIALARFEWLWLRSYNAAEADAMALGTLAGKAVADILKTKVVRHPSAACVKNEAGVAVALGLCPVNEATAILITRPEEAIKITMIPWLHERLFQAVDTASSIGMMLSIASKSAPEDDLFAAFIDLINAGAFILRGDDWC